MSSKRDVSEPGTPAASCPADAPASGLPSAAPSSPNEVEAFLKSVKAVTPLAAAPRRGRLAFAMDATLSRQPTWDQALAHQAAMFEAVHDAGGLDVQLIYFRGHGECRASRWVGDADALARLMTTVRCRGGHTQIGRVLRHIRREAGAGAVHAAVYVGDCMEEDVDDLAHWAGELGLLGIPVFVFQDGTDARAESAFRLIARLTGGAYCRLDAGSASALRKLLAAVAVYAAGGPAALEDLGGRSGDARLLLEQMRRPGR